MPDFDPQSVNKQRNKTDVMIQMRNKPITRYETIGSKSVYTNVLCGTEYFRIDGKLTSNVILREIQSQFLLAKREASENPDNIIYLQICSKDFV